MLGKIKQIAVTVKDLEASKLFYRDKLGLKLMFEAPPGLVFFDLDGIWLMLGAENEQEKAHPGSVLYFVVDDINAAFEQLKERGIGFEDTPHQIADLGATELWMTFFKDPDGTLLALRSEVPKR